MLASRNPPLYRGAGDFVCVFVTANEADSESAHENRKSRTPAQSYSNTRSPALCFGHPYRDSYLEPDLGGVRPLICDAPLGYGAGLV